MPQEMQSGIVLAALLSIVMLILLWQEIFAPWRHPKADREKVRLLITGLLIGALGVGFVLGACFGPIFYGLE